MAIVRPEVSVIIPFFGRQDWCREAIQSVLQQTFQDFELILVDDGSIEELNARSLIGLDPRIRYYRQNHQGVSCARNTGIELSRGEYIAFLDSDDLFLPNKLGVQVAYMKRYPEYGMSYSHAFVINEYGELMNRRWMGYLSGHIYPEMLFIRKAFIATPSVIVRSRLLREVGRFDENMDICEDLDMWRRIAKRYSVLHITETLVKIREKSERMKLDHRVHARTDYYTKAFVEDHSLDKKIRSDLFVEMFIMYALEAMRSGQLTTGGQLLVRAFKQSMIGALRNLFVHFIKRSKRVVCEVLQIRR